MARTARQQKGKGQRDTTPKKNERAQLPQAPNTPCSHGSRLPSHCFIITTFIIGSTSNGSCTRGGGGRGCGGRTRQQHQHALSQRREPDAQKKRGRKCKHGNAHGGQGLEREAIGHSVPCLRKLSLYWKKTNRCTTPPLPPVGASAALHSTCGREGRVQAGRTRQTRSLPRAVRGADTSEGVELGRRHLGVVGGQHLPVVSLKVKRAFVLVGEAVLTAEQALAAALETCIQKEEEGAQR